MSLIPHLFGNNYIMRPSRMFDQQFGMALCPEDLLQPVSKQIFVSPAGYIRHWKSAASEQDSGATVCYGKDQFSANLDVQQFSPEEITVKLTDERTITIEGKHEEKEDEHGHIFRHFIRKYFLPKDYDVSKLESKLSSDGVLSIIAPKMNADQITHKNIPVTQTGKPAKAVEEKAADKK